MGEGRVPGGGILDLKLEQHSGSGAMMARLVPWQFCANGSHKDCSQERMPITDPWVDTTLL